MSIPEFAWRIKMYAQTSGERFGLFLPKYEAPRPAKSGVAWHAKNLGKIDSAAYIDAADRILKGRYDIFSLNDCRFGFPPDWHKDPKTSTIAPKVFGMALNYRDEKIVGNIKYLWEINRHLELVTLAQAYHLTRVDKYVEGISTLLNSWLDQNPYPYGPNWTSSLEHAIRIVNWSFTWHILGADSSILFKGEKGIDLKAKWLRSIYHHCSFIYCHQSHYSSANNHLFGEYMGLFFGAITWPLWKNSSHWRQAALDGLEAESKKQITTDGVNREQAIWYHHEVADMMLLCGLIGKTNKIEFSSGYWRRLETMMEFIASIMDVNGNVPMIGDSDDAVMIRFSPRKDFHVYKSLLATGAVLFNRSSFKAKTDVFDEKSMWLLGEEAKKSFEAIESDTNNLPVRRSFPDGGYYILGNNFESEKEVRMVIDTGPLGYLSIAAHGHADALSVILSIAGKEFLIDPGTFAYHTQKKWRNYFRGTSAHNTVRVDGQDQSVIGGNFLWLAKASSKCEQWRFDKREDFFCGSHDGYSRLSDPVVHRRSVHFLKNECRIEITDKMICKGKHLVERFFHFSEQCILKLESDNMLVAENDGSRLKLSVSDKAKIFIFRADEKQPLGWLSRRFDEKVKTSSALIIDNINGTTELNTTFILEINI